MKDVQFVKARVIWRKGGVVKCPQCKKSIYKFVKTARSNDVVTPAYVIPLNGFKKPAEAEKIKCPSCGNVDDFRLALTNGNYGTKLRRNGKDDKSKFIIK